MSACPADLECSKYLHVLLWSPSNSQVKYLRVDELFGSWKTDVYMDGIHFSGDNNTKGDI